MIVVLSTLFLSKMEAFQIRTTVELRQTIILEDDEPSQVAHIFKF